MNGPNNNLVSLLDAKSSQVPAIIAAGFLSKGQSIDVTSIPRKKLIQLIMARLEGEPVFVEWKKHLRLIPTYLRGNTFCLGRDWTFEVCAQPNDLAKKFVCRFLVDDKNDIWGEWNFSPSGALGDAYFKLTGLVMDGCHNGRAEIGIFSDPVQAILIALFREQLRNCFTAAKITEFEETIVRLHSLADDSMEDDCEHAATPCITGRDNPRNNPRTLFPAQIHALNEPSGAAQCGQAHEIVRPAAKRARISGHSIEHAPKPHTSQFDVYFNTSESMHWPADSFIQQLEADCSVPAHQPRKVADVLFGQEQMSIPVHADNRVSTSRCDTPLIAISNFSRLVSEVDTYCATRAVSPSRITIEKVETFYTNAFHGPWVQCASYQLEDGSGNFDAAIEKEFEDM